MSEKWQKDTFTATRLATVWVDRKPTLFKGGPRNKVHLYAGVQSRLYLHNDQGFPPNPYLALATGCNSERMSVNSFGWSKLQLDI